MLDSFGSRPNTARIAPSISAAVRKRSHVIVTGSTVRSTMVSPIGRTPQNAAVTTANVRPSFQRPLSLCTGVSGAARQQAGAGGADHGARFYRTRLEFMDRPFGGACVAPTPGARLGARRPPPGARDVLDF